MVFEEYWALIGDLALDVRKNNGLSSVVWLLVSEEYWPFIGDLALGVRILALRRWSGSWCSKNIGP